MVGGRCGERVVFMFIIHRSARRFPSTHTHTTFISIVMWTCARFEPILSTVACKSCWWKLRVFVPHPNTNTDTHSSSGRVEWNTFFVQIDCDCSASAPQEMFDRNCDVKRFITFELGSLIGYDFGSGFCMSNFQISQMKSIANAKLPKKKKNRTQQHKIRIKWWNDDTRRCL